MADTAHASEDEIAKARFVHQLPAVAWVLSQFFHFY